MKTTPLVSIIIPTKNSAKTLLACITSIKRQTYSNIEYIVVDNYSLDATQDIAKNNKARLMITGNERSAQRNAGANHAHGEFLLFIDSDMELLPEVVDECVNIMQEHKNIQAIVIPEDSFGTTLWAACKNFERSTYANSSWLHGARFFRSSAFTSISGFQEDIIGAEDFDIHTRTVNAFGLSGIGYSSIAIRHNEGALTLTHLLKKKYYYGSTLKAYANNQRNKHMLYKQANPITRIQLFFQNPTFLFQHPIIFTATCIMKTLEFCALGLGYLMKSAV
ncbi:MAG: glycosyltransferase [Candidatus Andersenbacteria bacterium]|nr:glycosyltransferase [Candidatus Andersenbacteria bacterium]